jgi:hypothetical protein
MSEQRQLGEELAPLSGRWILGIEFGILLQILAIWWASRTVNTSSDILAQVMDFVLLIALMGIAGSILALSVWRDSHSIRAHTDWSASAMLWLIVVVCLPILAPSLYLWYRHSAAGETKQGVTGYTMSVLSNFASVSSENNSDEVSSNDSPSLAGDTESTSTPVVDDAIRSQLPSLEDISAIGQGGSGNLYRVCLDDGNVVALKIPRHGGTISQSVFETFQNEAETWEQIDDHPHIVDVIDWDVTPYPWLLLEYMNGGDLAQEAGLSVNETQRLVTDVCNGLHHAHKHGIVHHDLKPDNLLLTEEEGTETVKIGDWGLSRHLLNETNDNSGYTPQYAAPEQIQPDVYGEPDNQTDVYQIGLITYELLTGERVYEEADQPTVTQKILDEEPDPPSEVNGNISSELDEVILKAIDKEKSNRYESILLFRDALSEAT